ncbi:hypothetical protein Dimus_005689 [Dionaea muscipula]
MVSRRLEVVLGVGEGRRPKVELTRVACPEEDGDEMGESSPHKGVPDVGMGPTAKDNGKMTECGEGLVRCVVVGGGCSVVSCGDVLLGQVAGHSDQDVLGVSDRREGLVSGMVAVAGDSGGGLFR